MCIYVHVRVRTRTYVCMNFGRSHGQRVRIYPVRFPLQGQHHFCPRQRVYKARNMNWRFTLIVRQEVRVCRINSHSRETWLGFEYTLLPTREKGAEGFQLSPPGSSYLPRKCTRKKKYCHQLVRASSRSAQHLTMKVFLRFTGPMTNRRTGNSFWQKWPSV